jgi:serine phosphatase RsbU (regulator of sigma subunit)
MPCGAGLGIRKLASTSEIIVRHRQCLTGTFALQCMEIWGGSHAATARTATPGLDIWVSSQPHEAATHGGDVHYVSLCGGGVITRLIVADLSGHGASAADAALGLRALMRRNINRKDQSRLVRALNRQFLAQSQLRRFATAVVATYLTARDTLTVCNAGHPRPFWYHAATGAWEAVTTDGSPDGSAANLPLGIDAAMPYTQQDLPLGRGDLVLVYTDALIEVTDPDGKPLQEAGLLDLVRGLDASEPAKFGPALLDQLDRYRGGRPAGDDQTVVLLHHNAGHPRRLSLRESLSVYAKVLGLRRV